MPEAARFEDGFYAASASSPRYSGEEYEEASILAAEARLQRRLEVLEQADRDGRMWDVIRDVPSVWEQVRSSIEKRLI